jgi:hypothetical protein
MTAKMGCDEWERRLVQQTAGSSPRVPRAADRDPMRVGRQPSGKRKRRRGFAGIQEVLSVALGPERSQDGAIRERGKRKVVKGGDEVRGWEAAGRWLVTYSSPLEFLCFNSKVAKDIGPSNATGELSWRAGQGFVRHWWRLRPPFQVHFAYFVHSYWALGADSGSVSLRGFLSLS